MSVPTDPRTGNVQILIVGAGYTGLTMARALSVRLGGHVTVGILDRAPWSSTPASDPRATALSAGAVNALRRLGVWQRLSANAQPVHHIDITDPVGDSPLRQIMLSYDNVVDGEGPASWIVENDHLKAALRDIVAADPHIAVLAPDQITGLETNSNHANAICADGSSIVTELVIAADGAKSSLRSLSGIKTTGWPYKQSGIVTAVCHELPHNATATQHFLPAGPFAILPLQGKRSSIVWTEDADVAARIMKQDDAGFLDTVQDRFGTRLGQLELDGPRASWPLSLQLARQLASDRLALIGEAARTVHPIAGQGLNLAIRDISALVDAIADAVSLGIDPGNTEVLSGYAQARRFDAGTSALAFDAINRLFSNRNALLRSLRDGGLELVNRSPSLKSFFVHEAAGLTGSDIPSLMLPLPETHEPDEPVPVAEET